MALYEVLATRREDVITRWKGLVRGKFAPESMSAFELLDHVPKFLDEMLEALAEGEIPASAARREHSATATGHGAQRLRLGFRVDAVVREYGALREAILTTAQEAGMLLTLAEMGIVFDYLIEGIAAAVSEYSRQRDAELLRQANEHFAFVAHELRNPLSAAMLAFQQLNASGLLPSGERSVGVLERGLDSTSELIDHSLRTARTASGIELRRQWTTLRSLLADAELSASSAAEVKEIELRIVVERDERIHVDVRLLQSAISNLLRNGVKCTPRGGTVELRGRTLNGQLVVEVEDRCGGIDPDQLAAAFASFVRLDKREVGFGLGLPIAKQAAEAHGGTLRVQNLPDKGCIFALELPLGVANAEVQQP